MPTKFDFISPEVVFNEVDLSQLPTVPDDEGLLIIGRAPQGPSMQPVRVRNAGDLKDIFGDPQDGSALMSPNYDTWRDGNASSPTYGLYAAETWLTNASSPVTYIRLAGEDAGTQASGYTKAGWALGTPGLSTNPANNIMSYGLFVCPSGSAKAAVNDRLTGSLAAIFYTTGAAMTLNGKPVMGSEDAATVTSSLGLMMQSDANMAANSWKIDVWESATSNTSFSFNLQLGHANGLRSNANVNPQRLNTGQFAAGTNEKYFLGESYETSLQHTLDFNEKTAGDHTTAGKQFGILLPLVSGSTHWTEHQQQATAAKSGWIINRNPSPSKLAVFDPYHATKLFRIVALHEGVEFQNKYAIIIQDLKIKTTTNNKSSFTLKVVNTIGGDVETYSGLTLDSSDSNFIGRRIGNQYRVWDSTNKIFNLVGQYPNRSDYIRIELSDDLISGLSDQYALPFGFYGPFVPRPFTLASGSQGKTVPYTGSNADPAITAGYITKPGKHAAAEFNPHLTTAVEGNSYIGQANTHFGFHSHSSMGGEPLEFVKMTADYGNGIGVTASFGWGSYPLTDRYTNGGLQYSPTDLFGIRITQTTETVAVGANKDFFKYGDYKDLSKIFGGSLDQHSTGSSNQISFVFSLDQMVYDASGGGTYYHQSGAAGNTDGLTLENASYTALSASTSALLDTGVKQFVLPLFGGFDGLDVTQADPFSQRNVLGTNTANTHYAVNSIEKALDIAADRDQIRYDIISVPGLMHTALSNKIIDVVEKRADALAILDLDDNWNEQHENSGQVDTTNGTAAQAISQIKSRDWDSSYAATYFPRVRMAVGNNNIITVPASVAAIGAIAQSENDGTGTPAPWFAPAGFNRGGLHDLQPYPVVNTVRGLTKANRDDLYQLNVNPIARFAAVNSIVIFGQKTLQQVPSALDRVNVRRLMNYLKKRIGRIADNILFQPNLNATWNNFSALAGGVLQNVQSRYGIAEYKLVLDNSTTTADLIDRNIMYAKIFIKPARAIEFIAIDFIITRSGIEF